MDTSVTTNSYESKQIVEELRREGQIDDRLLDVLDRNIVNGQAIYNSIGTVSHDMKQLTTSVTKMAESVNLLMESYEEKKEESLMVEARKELMHSSWQFIKQALQGLLLISSTAGVIWAIFKFLVQSAIG